MTQNDTVNPRISEQATGNGLVPFPLARRRAFIERHARLIATMRPDAGERYLDRQLQNQFENLQRRGFDVQIIEREVIALDAAIRAALWRAVLRPGQR
jgi:hypothetical protein